MKLNETYSFSELEKMMQEATRRTALVLYDIDDDSKAMMLIFFENFCGDWLSGDGVLFYDNNETHSADDERQFTILQIIEYGDVDV